MTNKTEELSKGIDKIIRERGYDIWSVAGKDGIEQFLKDELGQILKLLTDMGYGTMVNYRIDGVGSAYRIFEPIEVDNNKEE